MRFLVTLLLLSFFGTRRVIWADEAPVKTTSSVEGRRHSIAWDGNIIPDRNQRLSYVSVMYSSRGNGPIFPRRRERSTDNISAYKEHRHINGNLNGNKFLEDKTGPGRLHRGEEIQKETNYDGLSNVKCGPGFWMCRDGTTCILETKKCSGTDDCPDKSDEDTSLCCLPNEFFCRALLNTTQPECVHISERCDGRKDCRNGEDEKECEKYDCPEYHMECDNKTKCISYSRTCDGTPDCDDGKDEENCIFRTCFVGEFNCDNMQCILEGYVCDDNDTCGDNSDEKNCSDSDFVTCENGERVHRAFWCDGIVHCKDNQADEIRPECEKYCNESHRKCNNGRCIFKGNFCDGQCDCVHCEDEIGQNCDTYDNSTGIPMCEDGKAITCIIPMRNRTQDRCIGAEFICDGNKDCKVGRALSDETNCSSDSTKNLTKDNRCNDEGILCDDGRFIWKGYCCDGLKDCLHGEDEFNCTKAEDCLNDIPDTCQNSTWRYGGGTCKNSTRRCDMQIDCLDKMDEIGCDMNCTEDQWKCDSGQCIPEQWQCNLFFDCLDKSDEKGCEYPQVTCNDTEFECKNVPQCIPIEDRCVDMSKTEKHHGCADKSHLWGCVTEKCIPREDLMQCHRGPCIPKSLQCNHIFDCPHTDTDEINCEWDCGECECYDVWINCSNLGLTKFPTVLTSIKTYYFANNNLSKALEGKDYFKNMSHLLHLDLSRNGLKTLKNGTFRDLSRLMTLNLKENNLTVLEEGAFNGLRHLQKLELDGNQIKKIGQYAFSDLDVLSTLNLSRNGLKTFKTDTFRALPRLKILDLKKNNLTVLEGGAFEGLMMLQDLGLDGNQIEKMEQLAFSGLQGLSTLDLRHQKLNYISPNAFKYLKKLSNLHLDNNNLSTLSKDMFNGLDQLKELTLTNNPLRNVSDDTFEDLKKLKVFHTDKWHWCCFARDVEECLPKGDEFSTCEDLMSNFVLRVFIWILGLIALIGNFVVVLWRLLYSTGEEMHSFLIVNLAIGDFLMGVYLLIIAAIDLNFRGKYFMYAEEWRSSPLCQVAGFISTFSSELSVFTLTVITVDRLIVIRSTFRLNPQHKKFLPYVMLGIWLLVVILSALPLAPLPYFDNFYGRSGVCLALHITNEKPNGWEYSVFIFLVINLMNFAVIAVSYTLMYITVRQTRNAPRRGSDRSTSCRGDGISTRLTLIVATDAACWLPIIFLGILSLSGVSVPPQVFSWVAVFVLPVNSAINPVLYTLSTEHVTKRIGSLREMTSFRGSHSWRSTSAFSRGSRALPANSSNTNDVNEIPTAETEIRYTKSKASVCIYKPVHQTSSNSSSSSNRNSNMPSNRNSGVAARMIESNGKKETENTAFL